MSSRTRAEVYLIALRAMREKKARTKQRSRKREIAEAMEWLGNDPAFAWEADRLALNPHADLHPEGRAPP